MLNFQKKTADKTDNIETPAEVITLRPEKSANIIEGIICINYQ